MKFQRMLSNGSWVDDSRVEYFVGKAVRMETWYAVNQKRTPMDEQGVMAALAEGKAVRYDSDWYAQIRDADAIKPRVRAKVQETLCACGHRSAYPMNTSRGTACPDCYDRMSD